MTKPVALLVCALIPLGAIEADASLEVGTRVSCPAAVAEGEVFSVAVTLENYECTQLEVRLMTSYVGNSANSLGGVRIFGPVVSDPAVAVPGSVDCPLAPQVLETSIDVAAPAVGVLSGPVLTYAFVAEWEGGRETQTDSCVIALPEPSAIAQLLFGIAGVLGLAHRRSALANRSGDAPSRASREPRQLNPRPRS